MMNTGIVGIKKEQWELRAYMLLLLTMGYTLFHHSLLPYFKPTELTSLAAGLGKGLSTGTPGVEGFISSTLYFPFLKYTGYDPVPVRLLFQSLLVACLFCLYWFRKFFVMESLAGGLTICLVFCTSPFLVSMRDLPEGLALVVSSLVVLLAVKGLEKHRSYPDRKPDKKALIAIAAVPVLTGPFALLWLSPLLLLIRKNTRRQRMHLLAVVVTAFLPIGIVLGFTGMHSSEFVLRTDPYTWLERLWSTAGWWLPAGCLSLGILAKGMLQGKYTLGIFKTIAWFAAGMIHAWSGCAHAAFIALNAVIIAEAVVVLLQMAALAAKPYRLRILALALFAIFLAGPFNASTKVHTSKKTQAAASIMDALGMIRSHEAVYGRKGLVPLGRGSDTTAFICNLLIDRDAQSEYDLWSRTLPDSIHFLTEAMHEELLGKRYHTREYGRSGDLVLVGLSHHPFPQAADSFTDARFRLERRMNDIRANADWMKAIAGKAQQNKRSIDLQLIEDACWSLLQEGWVSSSQYDSLLNARLK